MKFQIRVLISVLSMILWSINLVSAQKNTTILYAPDDDGTIFTSLDQALQNPQKVYRLKLTKLQYRDSLPEELFALTELRELTIKGAKLNKLNRNIFKLSKLKYLNLDKNKLVRLPETLGQLNNLTTLVISRNMIETLPESIGNLDALQLIDAWDNPLYLLPDNISKLKNTLKTIDLRQIPLTKSEYEAMILLLPYTNILFTDICECENRREHN